MDVVVGEDDPVQRQRLAKMISCLRPGWTQVAQVASAREVLDAIAVLRPQVLVLDIHLGDCDPGWIRRLPTDIAVVFTTVDPAPAVDAFQIDAADYVLKPLSPARLAQAFERAEMRLRSRGAELSGEAAPPLATVVASRGVELILIQTEDICYLQSDHKYTRVVAVGQQGLVRTTIAEFEQRLDRRYFKRIHRNTLVNLRMAQRVWRDDLGRLHVRVRCLGTELLVSRSYESVFRVL